MSDSALSTTQRRITHSYGPGSCLSCGGVARIVQARPGDHGAQFDCVACGPLHYAPAFDDRGRKIPGYAKPEEAKKIWAQYPANPFDDDIAF